MTIPIGVYILVSKEFSDSMQGPIRTDIDEEIRHFVKGILE